MQRTNQNSKQKLETSAKRGKSYNRCQAWESMQPVPNPNPSQAHENLQQMSSAGKLVTGANATKQTPSKNMKPVPSAGKRTTGAKRGTCNRCQTGKHVTGASDRKTCNRRQARENMQPRQPVQETRKLVSSAQARKNMQPRNQCERLKNLHQVPSAGKRSLMLSNLCQERQNKPSHVLDIRNFR